MKKNMKKLKVLIASSLIVVGCLGTNAYAATRKITASGNISSIYFGPNKPTAYLYTYNASGKYMGKYQLSVKNGALNKFKLSLGSTKLDDTKVKQVCLQVNPQYGGPKYSRRVNIKTGNYVIGQNSNNTLTLQ